MKKLFDEKPLPKGLKSPPDGVYFIGMDEELPRCENNVFYALDIDDARDNWTCSALWLSGESCEGLAIAAPASLVRRLSTQERARRAKPNEDFRVICGDEMTDSMTLEDAQKYAERRADLTPFPPVYVVRSVTRYKAESVVKKDVF